MTRRSLPEQQRDLGRLDADAIERVRDEAAPPVRDAEELHDLLLSLTALSVDCLPAPPELLNDLIEGGRAARASLGERAVCFAAEQLPAVQQLFPNAEIAPALDLPEGAAIAVADREEARVRLARGHMEVVGPITADQLGRRCGLSPDDIEYGLRQLEALGEIMRGAFTPSNTPSSTSNSDMATEEYCDRRLLARIHRYTISRLRAEIEPVSAQHYLRFLLRWQHLTPETQLSGKAGVRAVVQRLQGFEAPAAAWERDLLAPRVRDYREAWLDELCLAGDVTWARLTPRPPANGKRNGAASPSRATPITLALRRDFSTLLAAARRAAPPPAARGRSTPPPEPDPVEQLDGAAGAIHRLLRERGALFFDELVDGTRRIATDVENGLRELIAAGLAHADGFQGLRQLSRPASARRRRPRRPRYGGGGVFIGEGPAGRWAPLPAAIADEPDPEAADEQAEAAAWILLNRYGVLSRELMSRESLQTPWRDILRALRRLEARGEIRGGRFIQGLIGEQFALPEAIDQMRALRRKAEEADQPVEIAAADPCNLQGVLLPGPKIPARLHRKITIQNGLPAAS